MRLLGSIKDLSLDFKTNTANLTLSISNRNAAMQAYDDLKDIEKLDIEIKKYREKRSLNANALCWKLCNEIANVLRTDKDSIYLEMLKRYGQSSIVSVLSTVDVSGYFKYCDIFGTGYVNGKEFTHYKIYKGSSEYDSREMSILLDGIIDEAKGMGIEVLSEQELSLIKSEWEHE